MNITRLLLSCFMLILFHVNYLPAEELTVQTFRSNLERAHAQIFSVKGKYEFPRAYIVKSQEAPAQNDQIFSLRYPAATLGFDDNPPQLKTPKTPQVIGEFVMYQKYKDMVYYERFDKDFKNLTSKHLYRDGTGKILHYLRDKEGNIRMRGGIVEIQDLDDIKFQPFMDTFERLWGLLIICEKGGMDFIVTSVTYNDEECFLIEFPGTGKVPQLDGILQGLDPRMLEPYYNPKTTRKVWVGKDKYNPLKYEYYDRKGQLRESIEIHYQKVHGYDVDEDYYIPREIITEEYEYATGKLESKKVAQFIGEWKVNRIYPQDAFTLDFPSGLTVYDERIHKTYVVE